jgi:hypothetical protein
MLGLFVKFPIRVVIFKKYGNILKVVFDQGRIITKEEVTRDGIIKTEYLLLKNEKAKVPIIDIKNYFDIDNVRYVYLYQPERNVYIPCKVTQNYISINLVTYEKDEKGNAIPKVVEVPLVIPQIISEEVTKKELRTMFSNEILRAQERWKKISFWERWGGIIMVTLMLIFGVMIFITAFQQYSNIIGQASQSLQNVADALNKVADKLAQALQQNVTAPITPPKPPY